MSRNAASVSAKPSAAAQPAGAEQPVRAEMVSYRYPSGRVGLEELSLSVRAGEVVAAIGPNGSGKSTLLKVLATDLPTTVGELHLFGLPVRGSLGRIRARIGYAADDAVHFPWLTGDENARFFASLQGQVPPERLDRLFGVFQLEEVRHVPVAEYSFGMRRKLLLLEALAPAPAILLLDEPTVGLDPGGVLALRAEVRARAAAGAAVMLATNDTREIPSWADRILFLHRGRVVEDASRFALLERLVGQTRIEIELGTELEVVEGTSGAERASADARRIPGIEAVAYTGRALVVESSRGSAPLPELLSLVLTRGGEVVGVRVRAPDLGDLFQSLTGEALA